MVYFTTNFTVCPPTLMKYIPEGNVEMSICWVSAEMWPCNKVCPIRLEILNAECGMQNAE